MVASYDSKLIMAYAGKLCGLHYRANRKYPSVIQNRQANYVTEMSSTQTTLHMLEAMPERKASVNLRLKF